MRRRCDCPSCEQARGRNVRLRLVAAVTALVLVGAVVTDHDAAGAAQGRCGAYEALLARHGLPVRTFSHIMWRESRCQPRVVNRSSGTVGLLQIHPVNRGWLSRRLGQTVTSRGLQSPALNVRAAAALYRSQGLRPWAVG